MSRELDELLALTATLVPGLEGRVEDPVEERFESGFRSPAQRAADRRAAAPDGAPPASGIRPGADNAAAIRDLRDWWLERHPEAGPHYLSLRCWGLLIWQPIYLGMIAAHRSAIAPDLGRLDQPVVNGFICGYSIGRHDPLRGCLRQRMDAIAAQLRQICAAFYRELTQVLSLNPRAAACMQADCVLSALLAARSGEPAVANAWARETAADWLARLGIAGRSGYLAYQRDSLPVIAVDRQVCCHHFRRRDGDYCSTCPKLDTTERIARLDAESAVAA